MSDTSGIHVICLRDQIASRKNLVERLKAVGLNVDNTDETWRESENFDLEGGIQREAMTALSGALGLRRPKTRSSPRAWCTTVVA
ncbi:hypothetical protein O4328_37595 [Rhodococcus opacus]|uniref:Uncharacterized protein n=1 Tax=Rhodococcus opacus TaxID=37919 RepID=A0AAX3YVC2_RHOOP|nr:hypothetical protein [Rhodococcus opacus]MCZ4589292.1 hypothetical protein [Rhodococcus opacus]WLF51732.1 hypothetical protein Q5707_40295 [Rhodococcus opacus]WLF52471.1 hypothetical protein Q5707_44700 [Rhodococcus opacus]